MSVPEYKIREVNIKIKEALDYINVLNWYLESKSMCKYVLLLEDDSLAAENWYETLIKSIDNLNEEEPWYVLKLFTSYRWYDWLTHPCSIFKLICKSLILFWIKILILSQILTRIGNIYKIFLFVNSFLIFFLINCVSISPLDYGIHSFSLGFNAGKQL